ncbi:MAG: dihydropteroate synthase [Ectothiorhodospiraceae bacterium]|nr:dihydropteroate synthase [Ectothiorhodospiraceae bacterium]
MVTATRSRLVSHGPAVIDCGGKPIRLDGPQVMGVLNITPDSFSDGGRFLHPEQALEQARRMVDEGAALIDVGGESTRPGAGEVSVQAELDRVLPVLELLCSELPVPVSVDTSKPEVMTEAARAGAGMINDVMALRRDGALQAAAATGLPICLMHMQGEPRTMQQAPEYREVVSEVMAFLGERVAACTAAGISRDRIVLDPGFGFGKTLRHNYQLLSGLGRIIAMGVPVLVGMSRKTMIGKVLDAPVDRRLHGSVAAAVLAAREGALLIRAHDVGPTVEALAIVHALAKEDIPVRPD